MTTQPTTITLLDENGKPKNTVQKDIETVIVAHGGKTLNEFATHWGKEFQSPEEEFAEYFADQVSNLWKS